MAPLPAFSIGTTSSTFTRTRLGSVPNTTPLRPSVSTTPSTIRMLQKPGFFRNPFKREPDEPQTTYIKPQPGDPGFDSEPKSSKDVAQKLPVESGKTDRSEKRGLDLLQEDFLKSAPEKAGVGRQDKNITMRPMAGEPGYKPAAYQTVKVSQLGISPFIDDPNAVGKVGGVEAVVKAAQEVKKGATAKQLKNQILSKMAKVEPTKPEVFDIPDYLKPLPEDTPRKGMTWKNYVGR